MNTFGERLRQLRMSKKMSIGELVHELNRIYNTSISKSMISRYENGTADPKLENIRILADYFKVSADYLTGIHEDNITIAAHHDGDEWTEEELEEIERFKAFIRSKRKR